ncbi:MAG: hypothetical protein GY710_02075 [Desulfobacteraceae bacterium]|nr:hypothetical protein [Desulfobacteraceae bacterium]
MAKFKIKSESQEVLARMLQSEAKKLNIEFKISDNGKSFETDSDALLFLEDNLKEENK